MTGDALIRTTETNYFRSGAYAVNGDITWRDNYWDCGVFICKGSGDTYRTAPTITNAGFYSWVRVECRNCTVEAKVTNTNGHLYDFCTNWHY